MVIVSQCEAFCSRGLFSPVIWYAKGCYHYSTTRNVKYFMFFSLELCGKIASLLFFRRGLGVYLVQSVNRSPTLWLQAWVNEYMMLLKSWACRPSIRLPWPLMTWIDPVIQSWTFHKLNVKLGGENMFLPHPIFNCAKPAICSVCATDVNDSLNYAPFSKSSCLHFHLVYYKMNIKVP